MNDPKALCGLIRHARRAASLKQSDLARLLAVSQAAVSQYERGNTSALSFAKIQQAAEALGVDLKEQLGLSPDGEVLKYCEHPHCLANVTFQGHQRLIVRPRLTRANAGTPTYCPECGDLLMDHCPNEECARPVQEGSFCTACGQAYIDCGYAPGRPAPVEPAPLLKSDLDRILRHTQIRPA